MTMNERKPTRRQPLTASEMGRRGAAAVNGSRTKAQRSQFARRAVQARWKGTTRAERLAAMEGALQARWGKRRKQLAKSAAQIHVVEKAPEFLDPTMPFGKHKGKRLSQINVEAPGYLMWLLDNCDLKDFLATQVELALSAAGTPKTRPSKPASP